VFAELNGPSEESEIVVSYVDDSDSDDDSDNDEGDDNDNEGTDGTEEVERQRRQLEQMIRALDAREEQVRGDAGGPTAGVEDTVGGEATTMDEDGAAAASGGDRDHAAEDNAEGLDFEQRSSPFAFDYLEFEPAIFEQQTLLEERSVRTRLLRERSLLQTVASYLSATTAINDAMAPRGGGGIPLDDPGDSPDAAPES
jgi:hypothetical protein